MKPSVCRTLIVLVLALLAGTGTGKTAGAQPATEGDDPSPHSDAELVSEIASIQPGQPFTVGLRMTMEKGWHSYWKNPGDSGQPTSIDWALPDGFAAGAIQWPYPHRIVAGPLVSYGYSHEVVLPVRITPPDTLEPGTTAALNGTAEWLICADICLPAESEISLTLPVRAETPRPHETGRQVIAEAQAKLPQEQTGWMARASRSAGSYGLEITPPEDAGALLDSAYFFPAEKAVLDHASPQPISREDGSYLMALQQSEYAQEPAEQLRGVLVAPTKDASSEKMAVAINAPVDTARTIGAAPDGDSAGASMTLVWALLFAFGGGIILNLMPCVFPILSVKVLGFAEQSDEDDASIRKHGLTFGGGVLVSFWVLAGLLLALRAGGSQIGWGFQLQSPVFVALVAMLFFGIGLNLLGVFEVGTRLMNWGGRMESASTGSTLGSSFWSGVLATVVATPCTAPLMGAALGFALTLPAAGALLVFTALGLGMATPYVLLSMAPRLLQRLPEPGVWMETLRQVLAFPMFATTIWLVWVFGQQTGISGMAFLLAGLLLLGTGAWILGRWGARQLSTLGRLATRGVATLVLAGSVATALIGAGYERPAPEETTQAQWQKFSADKVEQLRAKNRPVFVDFTAAWCLTCQVNKRTTLTAKAVQQSFTDKNVALLKADWTNRDPEITRALKQHGRSGVPLYVLYDGSGSEPTLLPEILTQDIVLEALRDLPGGENASSSEVASAETNRGSL